MQEAMKKIFITLVAFLFDQQMSRGESQYQISHPEPLQRLDIDKCASATIGRVVKSYCVGNHRIKRPDTDQEPLLTYTR